MIFLKLNRGKFHDDKQKIYCLFVIRYLRGTCQNQPTIWYKWRTQSCLVFDGFWLPIWYLPTFLVDHCLSFFDSRILITHLVSSNFSRGPLSVFLWFTDSDYPFGIFQLFSWTIVCLSLIHGFWLLIWYLPIFLVNHCLLISLVHYDIDLYCSW
jgi:hypothetical protein